MLKVSVGSYVWIIHGRTC